MAVGSRSAPSRARVGEALARLSREGALRDLVRGALPADTLRRLLKDALPAEQAEEMPPEVWSSLAVGIALDAAPFAELLASVLHDHLAWDEEPQTLEDWDALAHDRPLEALWMAALSESRAVKKGFGQIAACALATFRDSPQNEPPSWTFVDGILAVHAETQRRLRAAERERDETGRRAQVQHERLEELREELRRLRRENAELRQARAQGVKRSEGAAPPAADAARLEDLERRLRRSEKERLALARELERGPAEPASTAPPTAPPAEAVPAAPPPPQPAPPQPAELNPRRRLLRQMLRKLYNKGKIGGAHTHEDNVYRGVADHEKGLAKDAIDLLYREGYLLPKPTTADPHVSLNPERAPEVREMIAGTVTNTRLLRFLEGGH